MKFETAPILLFAYKRLDTLKQTVSALQSNFLAKQSDIFIFSDAAKSACDKHAISEVRAYLHSIEGFKAIHVFEAQENKGLANSIIDGVTHIIEQYGKVIVLEDDLITSNNFLSYMNQALEYFESKKSIVSIAGYSGIIKNPVNIDVYFTQRSSSWGWATWQDRWTGVDWQVSDYPSFFRNKKQRKAFNRMGSDMSQMLDRHMQGKINSWAIRWCYHQFKHDLFSVHPYKSKVINIGFGSPDATNTKERYNRFKTIIDISGQTSFHFDDCVDLDPKDLKQFVKPFSFTQRLKYKILNSFFS